MVGYMKETYKIFQLMNFFISKYNYISFNIKGYTKEDEAFIASSDNKNYQMIRISMTPCYITQEEKERLEQFKTVIGKQFGLKDIKFLDIHICNDEIDGDFPFDIEALNTNYHDGPKLDEIYSGIYDVIQDSDNQEEEIRKNVLAINNAIKKLREKAKKRPLLKKMQDEKCPITFIIMGICILIYIMTLLFSRKYSTSACAILLGADYKIFTLGLHEFYRLLTYCFVHVSLLHLLCNLMAFYSVGKIVERLLGKVKYLVMLFTGILFGSLLNGALSGNGMLLGLSGGIYTLFTFFVFYYVSEGFINVKTFIPTILINIMLNFMPNVSWKCHLGGIMAGIMFYYIYKYEQVNKHVIALTVLLLLATGFKYVSSDNLKPYYGQTDIEMISVYNHLGFKNHATNISNDLRNIYRGGAK